MSNRRPPKRRKSHDLPYYDALASLGWLEELWKYRTSSYALIAANALPLFGVLFFGWDTFTIVFLYWAENVIVGAINVLKMFAIAPNANLLVWGEVDPNDQLNRERMERSRGSSVKLLRWETQASKLFFIPFFVVQYGLFCFVHGGIIFELFGRQSGFGAFLGVYDFTSVITEKHLWLCLAALTASHLVSFFKNYIGRGEYRRTTIMSQMFVPYPRIFVLHVAIFVGAFAAMASGSNFFVLLVLIIGKTFIDLSLHLAEVSRSVCQNETQNENSQPQLLPEVLMGEAGQAAHTTPAGAQLHPPLRSSSDG
jgi:hypothetical protein